MHTKHYSSTHWLLKLLQLISFRHLKTKGACHKCCLLVRFQCGNLTCQKKSILSVLSVVSATISYSTARKSSGNVSLLYCTTAVLTAFVYFCHVSLCVGPWGKPTALVSFFNSAPSFPSLLWSWAVKEQIIQLLTAALPHLKVTQGEWTTCLKDLSLVRHSYELRRVKQIMSLLSYYLFEISNKGVTNKWHINQRLQDLQLINVWHCAK